MKCNIHEPMHIHSLGGELREATMIAEYGGVRCTAIYNPFSKSFYVDDKYGIIQDRVPIRDDMCR